MQETFGNRFLQVFLYPVCCEIILIARLSIGDVVALFIIVQAVVIILLTVIGYLVIVVVNMLLVIERYRVKNQKQQKFKLEQP